MLVHVHQYRHDDAKETVRSGGDVDPDHDTEEYFDADDLAADEGWERTTYDGQTILRRAVSYDDVAAISVPQRDLEETSDDLPGEDLQLRRGGGIETLERTRIVEVIDEDP
ncbi:hypothetical protein [Natrononativus amylolyticus]|uniref:hypothetical protein n=1 Tax=Natrononativus amylolyticus TaxID=2963434 RepID=UPI0020CBECBE|nr:hypothetical protein [Natrononativus amylolyticus]